MVSQRTLSRDDFFFTVEQPVFRNGPVTVSAIAGLNYARPASMRASASPCEVRHFGQLRQQPRLSTFTPLFGGGVNVAVAQWGGPGSPETVIYATSLMGPAITTAGGNDRFNLSAVWSHPQVVGLSGDTGFHGNFTGACGSRRAIYSVTESVLLRDVGFVRQHRANRPGRRTSQVNFVRGDACSSSLRRALNSAAAFACPRRISPGNSASRPLHHGGMDDRIESTLPPVRRPKMVPRSYSRLNST